MSSATRSKRSRISQACKPCGTRKVKCNGATPRCGRCVSDNIQCFYSVSRRNTRMPDLSSLIPLHERPPDSRSPLRTGSSQPDEIEIDAVADQAPGRSSINPELFRNSNRLFQAYFRYIHPIWPLLYKPLYDSLDHQQLLAVIPQPLAFAILSLAVLINHVEVETGHLSKHDQALQYFEEALRSLKTVEGSPNGQLTELKASILHCQVYTILALQQHSVGAFSQAGVFCAIASSMAIDLSLHRITELDNYVEAQVKARLWWTIYVLEKMLSCEMNRPVILRAEEAETPFPSVDESDEYELHSDSSQAETIVEQRRGQLVRSRTISAFHTSIKIAKIMENVSREIYSMAARQRIRQDREAGEQTRIRLYSQLQGYEAEMEDSPLKLDRSGSSESIPVTVTNYVYMWLTTILLNRPFIENWQSSKDGTATASPQLHPADLCLSAANEICSTLKIYTRYMSGLPCDMIFPIFVAANILLRHWQQAGGQDPIIKARLELCVKWLNGLGRNWRGAEERRQILSESIDSTYQDTQAQDENGSVDVENLFEDYSNFTGLTVDNSFDLEYLQWVNSFDAQGSII